MARRLISWAFGPLLVVLASCADDPDFSAPSSPPHTEIRGGAGHAIRDSYPFLCGLFATSTVAEDFFLAVPCPEDGVRPLDIDLSCDALGCHGNTEYDRPRDVGRSARGGQAPSCFTCHGKNWNEAVDQTVDLLPRPGVSR